MSNKNVAELLVETLVRAGVERIYGVPGDSLNGITDSIRRMVDALERCLPARGRRAALAALSSMVGAVVLARLSDDPELASELLAAARDTARLR